MPVLVVETDLDDEPRAFEPDDGFADEEGVPDEELGWMRMSARLDPVANGTRVVLVTTFASVEQLQQVLDMGMVEGPALAMGQIDGVLAGDGAPV